MFLCPDCVKEYGYEQAVKDNAPFVILSQGPCEGCHIVRLTADIRPHWKSTNEEEE